MVTKSPQISPKGVCFIESNEDKIFIEISVLMVVKNLIARKLAS